MFWPPSYIITVLWEMNTNGKCGRPVGCKSMMLVLGPVFISCLFVMAQKVKGSRTCTRTAGKNGWSIDCSDTSLALERKSLLLAPFLTSPIPFLAARFILSVTKEYVKKFSPREACTIFANSYIYIFIDTNMLTLEDGENLLF